MPVITGTNGNDNLVGTAATDLIDALAGNDTLTSGGGADTLRGGTGDDTIIAGSGNELIDGGADYDELHYETAAAAITVDLTAGVVSGGSGIDLVSNIEAVYGSAFNDTMIGSAGDNDFIGGAGNDSIDGGAGQDFVGFIGATSAVVANLATGVVTGGAGNDTLIRIEGLFGSTFNDTLIGSGANEFFSGGVGNDSIDGGGGFDMAIFEEATAGVTVSLLTGTTSGPDGVDTLVNIDGLIGSEFNDSLTGNNADNRLEGSDGDDTLVGLDGNDTILGGFGNDSIIGGPGNDLLDGGDQPPQSYGPPPGDILDYSTSTGPLVLNLQTGVAVLSGGAGGTDTVSNFEYVKGTTLGDNLTGSTLEDEIFFPLAGDDTINGGGGGDAVIYTSATSAVTVNLNSGTATGGDGNDVLIAIRAVLGSNFADTLTGDGSDNVLGGGLGSDTLTGGGGNDQLFFGELLGVSTVAGPVTASLVTGLAVSSDGTDTFSGFTGIEGSIYGDALTGDDLDNSLFGDNGNDTITAAAGLDFVAGGLGDDSLDGGADTDYLFGGLGNDTIIGGADEDTVQYDSDDEPMTSGVNVNLGTGLATGGAGNDSLSGIENVQGSRFADTITGDAGFNYLFGAAGNDTLAGGLDDDILLGDEGFDTADYSAASGAVTVDLFNGFALGADGNDALQGIEAVRGSAFADTLNGDFQNNAIDGGDGSDTLTGSGGNDSLNGGNAADRLDGGVGNDQLRGDAGNDTLLGGNENDYLTGGADNDVLNGGIGTDTADYFFSDTASAVVVNLTAGTATGGGGSDTLTAIENVNGSDFDDIISGDASNNFLEGRGGNDALNGGEGEDTLAGGAGNDTLDGGATSIGALDVADYRGATAAVQVNTQAGTATGGDGADTLISIEGAIGSAYNDSLLGSGVDDIFYGGLGNDTMDGAGGANLVSYLYATGAVSVNLTTGTATGAEGNDTLLNISQILGSTYSDTLIGNGGNNFLRGRTGDDTISGGAGNDRAAYDRASGSVNVSLATNSSFGADGIDTLSSIENLRGSNFADTLTGDGGANDIQGRDGNDTIIGGDGNDSLFGENGNDSLLGGVGNDFFRGGAGNDVINGGTILDRVNYDDLNSISYTEALTGIVMNLQTGQVQDGQGGIDTLIDIDFITASIYNDSILGSSGLIFEQFNGLLGNDIIDGGALTDTLNGRNNNRVTYQDAPSAVTVDFTLGQATGGDGTDTLININAVRASRYGDMLVGSDRSDVTEAFDGREGDDTIHGGGGLDQLRYDNVQTTGVNVNLVTGIALDGIGGTDEFTGIEGARGSSFNDTLTGGNVANGTGSDGFEFFDGREGNDLIDGGVGFDRADYTSSRGAVVVTLGGTSNGTAQDGFGGTDTLINIEGVRGSIYNDTLTGSDSGVFESLEGREGNDTLDGRGGIDRVDYQQTLGAVTVNLATGTASDGYGGTDTLANIENVRGSRDFNDSITGNAGANLLEGVGGNDTINAGAGNDTLDGGAGADSLVGGDGSDIYVVDFAGDVVSETNAVLATGGDDLVRATVSHTLSANVENLWLIGVGAINATGNGLNNILYAGAGDNVLDGAAGTDTASYAGAPSAVTVNLSLAGAQATGGSGSDTLTSVEVLAGSTFDDTLTGTAAGDTLRGNAGADTLNGGAGADVLDGESGADSLVGGAGSDNYYLDNVVDQIDETDANAATGGTDTAYTSVNIAVLWANVENIRILGSGAINVVGNGLNNLTYAGAGNNVLDGGNGTDTASYVFATAGVTVSLALTTAQATGGSGSDILRFTEYLTGSNFNDNLSGNAGVNVLDGGAGADTLTGGAADDNYIVDNTGDVVIETDPAPGFGGRDTVYASVSTTLSANVENLRLVPATAVNGTGNAVDNTIYAGNGNNVIDGAGGIDTVSYAFAPSAVTVSLAIAGAQATGGSGSDTLLNLEGLAGSAFNDNLTGTTGNDLLYGGAGVDTLSGGAGQDVLDGQAGADSMVGGDGGDNYTIDNALDLTVETNAVPATGGIDTAYTYVNHTLQANVENARILERGAVNLTGNALANTIWAGRGNNVIDAAGGNDTISYVYQLGGVNVSLANAAAQNTIGSGTDTLSNLENIIGSNFADNLTGTAGANVIDGWLGADIMIGGDGSDLYYVDNTGDNIIEANANPATGGSDLVYATASYTLGANVENLRQTGAGAINATGNAANNILYAGAGNNTLDGAGGSDTVSYAYATAAVTANLATGQATGGSGTDTLLNVEHLIGSGYADTLTGNTQANSLTGGTGADIFVLNSVLASDTISDFASGSDKVRISQAGIAIGNGNTTVDNATTIAGPGGFATTAELVIVSGNIAGALSTASAAAAIGSAGSAYGIGAKALFVVDNGSSSAAYLFTAADANAVVSAAELTLLATLSNTAATVTGDWVFGS